MSFNLKTYENQTNKKHRENQKNKTKNPEVLGMRGVKQESPHIVVFCVFVLKLCGATYTVNYSVFSTLGLENSIPVSIRSEKKRA